MIEVIPPAISRAGNEKALLQISLALMIAVAMTSAVNAVVNAADLVSETRPRMKADPVISVIGSAKDHFPQFLSLNAPRALGIAAALVQLTLAAAIPSERIDERALLPGVKVDKKDPALLESSETDLNALSARSVLSALSELLPLLNLTTSGAAT